MATLRPLLPEALNLRPTPLSSRVPDLPSGARRGDGTQLAARGQKDRLPNARFGISTVVPA